MIDPKPASQANVPTRPKRFGGTSAQIRSAMKFYKVMAYATGAMLLLLCVEMIMRYAFGLFLFAGGTNAVTGAAHGFGFADAEPPGVIGGANISVIVLIVHGWMYVLYLIAIFRLWLLMRWQLGKVIVMALGGVIPLLSFFVEKRIHAEVEAEIAANPEAARRY